VATQSSSSTTMNLLSSPDIKSQYVQSFPQLKDEVTGLTRKRQRSYSRSSDSFEKNNKLKLSPQEGLSPVDSPLFRSIVNSPETTNSVPCDKEKDSVLKRKRRSRAPAPFCDNLFCHSCGETQTSEWRRGPDGFKSLCNACGLHYAAIVKKEKLVPSSAKKITLDMLLNTEREEEYLSKSTSSLPDSTSPFSSDDSLSPRDDFKPIFIIQ